MSDNPMPHAMRRKDARPNQSGPACHVDRQRPAAPAGSVQNDRRQFSKSEREMPYRLIARRSRACILPNSSTTALEWAPSGR